MPNRDGEEVVAVVADVTDDDDRTMLAVPPKCCFATLMLARRRGPLAYFDDGCWRTCSFVPPVVSWVDRDLLTLVARSFVPPVVSWVGRDLLSLASASAPRCITISCGSRESRVVRRTSIGGAAGGVSDHRPTSSTCTA